MDKRVLVSHVKTMNNQLLRGLNVEPRPYQLRIITKAIRMFLGEYVHYAFDRSDLDESAQEVLRRKADFLRDNPDTYITIEGHADERGTNEYNLALGDRRAESAKSFVVDLGIEAYRISTVSYGEERPLCYISNEECWAKNRRAAFVIN